MFQSVCVFLKMSISCRLLIVGLDVLILSNIAQPFVLLTANVEDVKKVASKFVSDSLAEKITEFIVKATEIMSNARNPLFFEGKNVTAPEQHELSAENKMYNVRHGLDSQAESKEDIVYGKTDVTNAGTIEKKRPELQYLDTTAKVMDGVPKPLQGKSLYIVDRVTESTPNTDSASFKTKEEVTTKAVEEPDTYQKGNFVSTPIDEMKPKFRKSRGKSYRLLSGSSVENDASNYGNSDRKSIKDDDFLNIKRTNSGEVILAGERYASEIDPHHNAIKKGIKKSSINKQVDYTKRKVHDQYDNVIYTKTNKVKSLTLVTEKNWWEKSLLSNKRHGDDKGKSWF